MTVSDDNLIARRRCHAGHLTAKIDDEGFAAAEDVADQRDDPFPLIGIPIVIGV